MRKVFWAITGVAALLFLAGPYWLGGEVEQVFEGELARVRQAASLSGLVVEATTYKRGFFHSLATVELAFPLGPGPERIHLVSESLIHHGPVMLLGEGWRFGYCAGTTRLAVKGLPPESARILAEAVGPYLMTATSRVDFSRESETSLRIPSFTLAREEGKVVFAGLRATMAGDLALRHISGTINTGALTVTLAEGGFELSPGVLTFELSRYSEFLHLGRVDLHLERMAVTSGGESLSLRGVDFASKAALAEGRINLDEKVSVQEIAAPFPLTAASYRVELNRVDPEAFTVFGRMAKELNDALLDPAVAFPQFYESKVRELVSAVLREGLQCNQTLELEAMGGKVWTNLEVEFAGLPPGVHPLDVRDPSQYLAAVKLSLAVRGDEEVLLASPAAPLVGRYLEQGLIAREGQTLTLKAAMSGGQLSVGGKSLPLTAFWDAASAAPW